MDHTSLDKYIQHIYRRGVTMSGIQQEIKLGQVIIQASKVVLVMGNNQFLMTPGLSPCNQIKKLVMEIFAKYGRKIEKIWIGTVLPRLDREVELELLIRDINKGFSKAVKELKNHRFEKKRTAFLQLHKLFLEKFIYVDILTGHQASHLRVVKPVSTYFIPGRPELNDMGVYHLKSFILQHLGVLDGVNSWVDIPEKREPKEIIEQKRAAWLNVYGRLDSVSTILVHDESDSTDVEDEAVDLVSVGTSEGSQSGQGTGCFVPIFAKRGATVTSGE